MYVFRVLMGGANVPQDCTFVYKFSLAEQLVTLNSLSTSDDICLNSVTGGIVVAAKN